MCLRDPVATGYIQLAHPEISAVRDRRIGSWFRDDLRSIAGPDRDAQASFDGRNEPEDGRDHGDVPTSLGLLRLADSVATGHYLERDCRYYQFPECRRVFLLFT